MSFYTDFSSQIRLISLWPTNKRNEADFKPNFVVFFISFLEQRRRGHVQRGGRLVVGRRRQASRRLAARRLVAGGAVAPLDRRFQVRLSFFILWFKFLATRYRFEIISIFHCHIATFDFDSYFHYGTFISTRSSSLWL